VYAFSELPEDELASAFVRHDYPWHDGDPHLDDYRRWRPDEGTGCAWRSASLA